MKGLPSILKMDEAILSLDNAGFEAAQDLQTKMPIHNITFHEIEQMGKTARCELQELLGDSLGGGISPPGITIRFSELKRSSMIAQFLSKNFS